MRRETVIDKNSAGYKRGWDHAGRVLGLETTKPKTEKVVYTPTNEVFEVPKFEYKSAAAMFRGLILKDELSDDDILKAVQDKFNLDDSKKSYVKWYRNDLKKNGILQ